MQVIDDPQTFQTSDIVQKSSKTGLFSNKRLLVIRHGFLYYFSNVPKIYKGHVPDLLDTLQQLPKSSIEIKTIHTIKLESAKSADLIIKFYEKDMIDREDIRKSIKEKSFSRGQKSSQELEEWKFTFITALQCRLWYTALMKLKQHFLKQDDKIREFFEDFDPNKRISRAITRLSQLPNGSIPPTEQKKETVNKEGPSRQSPIVTNSASLNKIQQKSQLLPIVQQYQQEKPPSLPKIQENQSPPKTLEPRKLSHDLQTISERVEEQEKLRKLQEQIRKEIEQQIRHQERNRAEKHIEVYQSRVTQKQAQICLLNKKLEEEKQNRKQQKDQQLKFHYSSPSSNKKASVKQFSIQTQSNQKLQQSSQMLNKIEPSIPYIQRRTATQQHQQTDQSDLRHSAVTQLEHHQRQTVQTINIFRNTISYLPKAHVLSEEDEQSYDFYDQQGFIFAKGQKFQEQTRREMQLVKYISHIKREAMNAFSKYIDDNNPKKCLTIERGIFTLEVVCCPGKTVNINGLDKLVYFNKEHQRLKRQFKLYNFIQNKVLSALKKKSDFSLRVPLTYHAEYRGYSALVQVLPSCHSKKVQTPNILRQLESLVGTERLFNFEIRLIKNRSQTLYLIISKQPYKVTQQKSALPHQLSFDAMTLIQQSRRLNISTCSSKLQKQLQKFQHQIQKGKQTNSSKVSSQQQQRWDLRTKIESLKLIKLCRQLKNLYRSSEPYSISDSSFFKAFLESPQEFLTPLSESTKFVKKGYLISCLCYFFGLHIYSYNSQYENRNREIFQSFQNIKIEYFPVSRQFDLQKLPTTQLILNFEKYCEQGRLQLAQRALQYIRELEQDAIKLDMSEVIFLIKSNQNCNMPQNNLQKNTNSTHNAQLDNIEQCIQKLQRIQQSLSYYDLRHLKCSAMLIQCYRDCSMSALMMKELSSSLDYIDFMFGSDSPQKGYLYLLTAQILIKQGMLYDGIKLYRQLLQNYRQVVRKEQVYLSVSKGLLECCNADPNQLIEFVKEIVKEGTGMKIQGTNKEILDDLGYINTQEDAQLYQHLGLLYKKARNNDRASRYFERLMKYYQQRLNSDEANPNCLSDVLQIGQQILECYKSHEARISLFHNLFKTTKKSFQAMSVETSKTDKVQAVVRRLYTGYFCDILDLNTTVQGRESIRNYLGNEGSLEQDKFRVPISNSNFLQQQTIQFIIRDIASQKKLDRDLKRRLLDGLDVPKIESYILTRQLK